MGGRGALSHTRSAHRPIREASRKRLLSSARSMHRASRLAEDDFGADAHRGTALQPCRGVAMAELLRVLRTLHRTLHAQPMPRPLLFRCIAVTPGLVRLGYRLRPTRACAHRRGAR